MKKIAFIFLLSLFSTHLMAGDVINVKVKGMVCSYCSSGVKKKFSEVSEVEKVDVNMDENLVKLTLKDNKSLEDERITDIITASGFNISSIER